MSVLAILASLLSPNPWGEYRNREIPPPETDSDKICLVLSVTAQCKRKY